MDRAARLDVIALCLLSTAAIADDVYVLRRRHRQLATELV